MDRNEELRGYAALTAAQPLGSSAALVSVEADVSRGLHAFSIVGLADKAVGEARDRISSAIRHSGLAPPKASNRRIVLSLAPADLKKEGTQYDLALAIAYLGAAGEIQILRNDALFAAELSLDGSLRGTRGVLAQVRAAQAAGFSIAYVAPENAAEAALASGMRIYAPRTLRALIAHLKGEAPLVPYEAQRARAERPAPDIELRDIRGQESAKRALLIAATGRHNLMLYGPPGTGKTLLARALPGILPALAPAAMLEATAIHSSAGLLDKGAPIQHPPLRAPHHTASYAAMVGGAQLRPGEVTLAHHGVLFMDEFVEFDARTLEALREPLEEGKVTLSRARLSVTHPADMQLIAAMNPPESVSEDAAARMREYARQARKLSRPIADRIDVWVEVPRLTPQELEGVPAGITTKEAQKLVAAARAQGEKRSALNARLSAAELQALGIETDAREALRNAASRLGLSPRSYHRTLRVARSIADLAASENVKAPHVLEALHYRPRGLFGYQ